MRRILFALMALAASGCDKAIEMRLTAPIAGEDVDTSCVTAVELTLASSNLFDELTRCVEVAPGHVDSLRDHNLAGLFDEPLPDWPLGGVQLRGVAAPEGCTGGATGSAVGPTIFVASSDVIDDTIEMPMRGVVSCADKIDAPTPVRVVDLQALITDGTCAGAEGLLVQPGELFPTLIYGAFSGWLIYFWAPPTPVAADGLATLPYTFSNAATGSCVGLWIDDGLELVGGCLTPAGRGACGPEPEFHYIPYTPTASASLSTEEAISRTNVVFGVVVDRDRAPIAGATVTTAAPDTVIHYTNPTAMGFAPAGGAGTTATGTFTVLSNRPVLIEVSAPGMGTRRVMAGGNGGTVVVMSPGTP